MGSVSFLLSFASFYAGDGHSLLPGAGDFAWVHRLLNLADIWALGCIFGCVKVENYWIKFSPGVEDTQKKMLKLLLCKF
ncbi:hypothetical protein RchiOBHm_Chr6g0258871 [Rosa chinensis]|uniref:Uncharacterized protein n=1 Tax=Rosa chinensis TaxID=74649 RepID=A0A2P6PMQ7_ROSCH|nr:hypothetical protein RchiOBHm_Chr6g0258871 [Rosa chinensis]